MSISTGSICSYDSYRTSSDSRMSGKPTPPSKKGHHDVNTHKESLRTEQLAGWRKEICEKVNSYEGDVQEYLRVFVPSRTPCPLPQPAASISAGFTPEKGKEIPSYPILLNILTTLVEDFPDDVRPSFYGGHRQPLRFPFKEFSYRHHTSSPDFAVSFPGDVLPRKIIDPDWSRFSMVIEVKAESKEDPFTIEPKLSETRANKLVQLAVSARSLMSAHGYLASFALGIYGDVVRIARFDHACAVTSPPMDLKSKDGLRAIQEFFWRFVHPWEGGPGAVVGADPTIRKLTPADSAWLKTRLGSEADQLLQNVDLAEARWVKVYDDDKPAKPRAYVLFQLLDVNARLFSRSTMVWLGIEDTRFFQASSPGDPDGELDGPVELHIVKEAWRQVIRIPEKKFYDRLKIIPDNERIGLPDLLHGGDLGERDVARWKAAQAGAAWCDEDDLLKGAASPTSDTEPVPSGAGAGARPEKPDIPHPMHQTWSWRLGRDDAYHANERSHMRFVMDTVGRPLSRFRSTKELVMAIRDAIVGHRLAMERGGVLHRDVSSGNILIVERAPRGRPLCHGILHDYDYSSMTLTPPAAGSASSTITSTELPPLYPLESLGEDETDGVADLKERTGTYYFIALKLLDPEVREAVHDVKHDLESYLWVLLWIILRHTEHDNVHGAEACSKYFKFGDDQDATLAKIGWLFHSRLKIKNNAPLTDLLSKFKSMVKAANPDEDDPVSPSEIPALRYQPIIDIFDAAIAREDWPENDAAIPFTPPRGVTTVVEGALPSEGQQQKQKKRRAAPIDEEAEWLPGSGGATLGSNGEPGVGSRKRPRRQASESTPMSGESVASGSRRVTRSATQASRSATQASGSRPSRSGATGPKTGGAHGKASGGRSGKGSKGGKPSGAR